MEYGSPAMVNAFTPRYALPCGGRGILNFGSRAGNTFNDCLHDMNSAFKDHIYSMVYKLVCEDVGFDNIRKGRCCFSFMMYGMDVLKSFGIPVIYQAGTASFRAVPELEDDGVMNTHHAFKFEPSEPSSRAQIEKGLLPEIHCWLARRDTREIIDFSTGFVHMSSRIPWRMPPLPKYIWQKEGDPYPGTHYFAEMDAIRFILNFIQAKEFACQ